MLFESVTNLGERAVRGMFVNLLPMILVSSGPLLNVCCHLGRREPLFRTL